jgi:hypothetical protein
MIERDDAGVGERDASHRYVARHAQLEQRGVRAARVHVVHVVVRAASVLQRLGIAPAREQAAVARELRDRKFSAPLLDALHGAADARVGERRDVDVVAFLERDVCAVGRRDDLVGRGEAHVLLLVAAVGPDRHERRAAASAAGARHLVDPEHATFGSERRTDHLAA